MKKPRFTKCVFFVFWPLGAIVYCFGGPWRACWGHLQECQEPNDEKTTFYKVWFFRFLAFKGHCVLFSGALEGTLGSSLGMPRTQQWKKHVLQSVFFSVFGLKGPLCTVLGGPGGHVGVIFRNATNPTMKKITFYKVCFFSFLAFKGRCVLFWGALEGMLGSSSRTPRTQQWKKHVLQSVVFSFFGL